MTKPYSLSYLDFEKSCAQVAVANRQPLGDMLTLEAKWQNGKRCSTTDLLKSMSSPMSLSKTSHRSIRKYPPCNRCQNRNKIRLQEVAQNKKESTTKTCVLPCVLSEYCVDRHSGRRTAARQACRCRRQLQGGPRSPHQEPPGISIAHRKLCLFRLSTFSATLDPATVRISSVQYSY